MKTTEAASPNNKSKTRFIILQPFDAWFFEIERLR